MEAVHTAERLKELQVLPLDRKIQITQTRIIEWYLHYGGNVCVSFSGGKDSTVLLHIARQIYPDIPAVFSNTGLEYPEIQRFVRSNKNVEILVPDMRFTDVITTYGYPLIGKEVAEAIYYARRIRRQSARERERRQTDLLGQRSESSWNSWERGYMETHGTWGGETHKFQTSGAKNRRAVLSGQLLRSTVDVGGEYAADRRSREPSQSTRISTESDEPG